MSQSYGNFIPTTLANAVDTVQGISSVEQLLGTSISGQGPASILTGGLTLTIVVDTVSQSLTLPAETNIADTAAYIQSQMNAAPSGTTGTSVSGASPATTASGLTFNVNINGDGAQPITLSTGAAATHGTSISAASPAPSQNLTGGTLAISIDGIPVSITLGADPTGAAIAADIQALIRAFVVHGVPFTAFTCTFNLGTGQYTLSSGSTGPSSTVVVTGASDAVPGPTGLGLGIANGGTEAAGAAGTSGDTTGAQVAADIQAKIRALMANTLANQSAISATTVVYTSVYTITSGTGGSNSSVVVTGAGASTLKLGVANGGTETQGVTVAAFSGFTAIYNSGLDQLVLTSGTAGTAGSSVVVSAGTAQGPLKLGTANGGSESYTGHEVIVYTVTYLFVYTGESFGAGSIIVNSSDLATPTSVPQALAVAAGRAASVKASLAPNYNH